MASFPISTRKMRAVWYALKCFLSLWALGLGRGPNCKYFYVLHAFAGGCRFFLPCVCFCDALLILWCGYVPVLLGFLMWLLLSEILAPWNASFLVCLFFSSHFQFKCLLVCSSGALSADYCHFFHCSQMDAEPFLLENLNLSRDIFGPALKWSQNQRHCFFTFPLTWLLKTCAFSFLRLKRRNTFIYAEGIIHAIKMRPSAFLIDKS